MHVEPSSCVLMQPRSPAAGCVCSCSLTAVCPAVRHGGVREYDSHNLFGTAMAHDHYRAVKSITGKRPFLLSRCLGVPLFGGKKGLGLLCLATPLGGESNHCARNRSLSGSDLHGVCSACLQGRPHTLTEAVITPVVVAFIACCVAACELQVNLPRRWPLRRSLDRRQRGHVVQPALQHCWHHQHKLLGHQHGWRRYLWLL